MVLNKTQIKELIKLNPHANFREIKEAIEIINGYSDLIIDEVELMKIIDEIRSDQMRKILIEYIMNRADKISLYNPEKAFYYLRFMLLEDNLTINEIKIITDRFEKTGSLMRNIRIN